MSNKKISWYDLHNLHSSELKNKYKINDKQLEQGMRKHMDGANSQEQRKFYGDVWDSKNKS